MTPYRVDVIQLREIIEATVACHNCGTQITIRLDRLDHSVPRACPACMLGFDENLGKILTNFRESFLLAGHTKFRVEFQIKAMEKQSSDAKTT